MVRLKNRFIIAQLVYNTGSKDKFNEISSRDVQVVLKEKIIELYGDIGVGEFGNSTLVRYFEIGHSKIIVIRTTREAQSEAHLAMSCVVKIKDVDVTLRSLSIHSCPRTCMDGLKTVLGVYFDNNDLKGVDKDDTLQLILDNLSTVDL
jgi:RNase P/RNase MRP subunit POP5